ncbi:MAG: hypothetical protein RIR86_1610 [Acidobacteriota bacterium]|jgi:hypothetical protein
MGEESPLFLYKCLIAVFVFAFVVYVLKAIARLRFFVNGTMGDVRRLRDQIQGGAEMVRCSACGAFVTAHEAVTLRSSKSKETFCSTECLQKNVR